MKTHMQLLAAGVALLPTLCVAGASASQPSELALEMEMLAVSIRDAGHTCDRVDKMQRVDRFDEDIRAGWLVQCGEARFRVIYIGSRGFEVTPLAP